MSTERRQLLPLPRDGPHERQLPNEALDQDQLQQPDGPQADRKRGRGRSRARGLQGSRLHHGRRLARVRSSRNVGSSVLPTNFDFR